MKDLAQAYSVFTPMPSQGMFSQPSPDVVAAKIDFT